MNEKICKKICLISDSTGETLRALYKAVVAQFTSIEFESEIYPEIRMASQLHVILDNNNDGYDLLLYTFARSELAEQASILARANNIPAIDVLSPLINQFAMIFGVQAQHHIGTQHLLNEEYFQRIAAIDFTLNHDDGLGQASLSDADVILLGLSRTSKSPTATYLANRGVKCANIPFVRVENLPAELYQLKKPLIVGLIKNSDELVEIRKIRLQMLNQNTQSDYTNVEKIEEELKIFTKICKQNQWAIIDVSHRSIEESAAVILRKLKDHQEFYHGK